MTTKEAIQQEIDQAPELVLEKALVYIRMLKTIRDRRVSDAEFASKAALKNDWLKPEEDAAWQNL
jgi:hypothetical protein